MAPCSRLFLATALYALAASADQGENSFVIPFPLPVPTAFPTQSSSLADSKNPSVSHSTTTITRTLTLTTTIATTHLTATSTLTQTEVHTQTPDSNCTAIRQQPKLVSWSGDYGPLKAPGRGFVGEYLTGKLMFDNEEGVEVMDCAQAYRKSNLFSPVVEKICNDSHAVLYSPPSEPSVNTSGPESGKISTGKENTILGHPTWATYELHSFSITPVLSDNVSNSVRTIALPGVSIDVRGWKLEANSTDEQTTPSAFFSSNITENSPTTARLISLPENGSWDAITGWTVTVLPLNQGNTYTNLSSSSLGFILDRVNVSEYTYAANCPLANTTLTEPWDDETLEFDNSTTSSTTLTTQDVASSTSSNNSYFGLQFSNDWKVSVPPGYGNDPKPGALYFAEVESYEDLGRTRDSSVPTIEATQRLFQVVSFGLILQDVWTDEVTLSLTFQVWEPCKNQSEVFVQPFTRPSDWNAGDQFLFNLDENGMNKRFSRISKMSITVTTLSPRSNSSFWLENLNVRWWEPLPTC